MNRKIKIMVIDDAMLFRKLLKAYFDKIEGFEVVAVASDPYDAKDKILKYKPDVITMDVEMPRMDGITFIRQLLPQYMVPVVIVSGVNISIFKALSSGAVDFIRKPLGNSEYDVNHFLSKLASKIRIATKAKIQQGTEKRLKPIEEKPTMKRNDIKLIAVGASTGGTNAFEKIIKILPVSMPPIVVVQHMPSNFTKLYANRLNDICRLSVKEAVSGERLKEGTVYIAPGDLHMAVQKIGTTLSTRCFLEDKVCGHRPSVDVLFNSVAKYINRKSIGVILTGMGKDGAKGLLQMKQSGAYTIGQDEASCVVYGMPKVAYEIGAVNKQMQPERIAKALVELAHGDGD